MTEFPPRWRPYAWGPWAAPNGSQSAGRKAFSAQRSQPDTFRGGFAAGLAGARPAPRPAAAAAAADWLCLGLTDGAAAEARAVRVARPAGRLLIAPGATVIDFSTNRSGVSRSLAERLGRQGAWPISSPGDRWHGRGQSRQPVGVGGRNDGRLERPAPAGGGRQPHHPTSAGWLRAAGQGGPTRCWWPAATPARGRGDGPGRSGWGCRWRRSSGLSSGRRAFLGPGEPGWRHCWRGFVPLVSAGAARQGPGHRSGGGQPPTGWSCRWRRVAAIEDALIEGRPRDEGRVGPDPLVQG